MNRLALIGVSHRRGGAAALESWQAAFPGDPMPGFHDWVPLITCNRWNVITALPPGMAASDAQARLSPPGETVRPYIYLGDAALEQLCRIAASLDSLNPGEDQIMKQVRAAFTTAKAQQQVGPVTEFAFDTALRIAKRVRREVELAPMNTSLFSLARPALEAALPDGGSVAIIGAGKMGALAATTLAALKGFDLIIVNRNPVRAQTLAQKLDAKTLDLDSFLRAPPHLDALVCATPVADLITPEIAAKLPGLRCLVDLGLPRNVHVDVVRHVQTLNVDSLQAAGQARRKTLVNKLATAEQIIQDELETALNAWTERQLGPSIKQLRDWYLKTIKDTVPEEDAAKLAHKFAHVPIKGVRAIAREYGLEAAELFLAEAGLA